MISATRSLRSFAGAIKAPILTILLTSSAVASPASPLRFSEAYKAYLCAESSIGSSQKSAEQGEQERAKLHERYKEALQFPYPAEFRGYKPKEYEILERARIEGWPWSKCASFKKFSPTQSPRRPKRRVSQGFSCRLDRVVYGDRRTGERFTVTGVQLSLMYLLDQGTENQRFVNTPPPLGSDPPSVYGQLSVRGTHKGKTALLIHEWNKGTPAEIIYSTNDEKSFNPIPITDMPYVNARTYNFYLFGIDEQLAGIKLGPLRSRNWQPIGCQP